MQPDFSIIKSSTNQNQCSDIITLEMASFHEDEEDDDAASSRFEALLNDVDVLINESPTKPTSEVSLCLSTTEATVVKSNGIIDGGSDHGDSNGDFNESSESSTVPAVVLETENAALRHEASTYYAKKPVSLLRLPHRYCY